MRPDAGTATLPAVLRAVMHDLAQSAASAALAVEIAMLEHGRDGTRDIAARLATASEQLAVLQSWLRLYGSATPEGQRAAERTGGIADPAAFVAALFPGARTRPCPAAAFPPELLRLALRRIGRILGEVEATCSVAPSPSRPAVLVRLTGGVAPRDALAPWVALLRSGGAKVRLRRGAVAISLPYSASAPRVRGQ